MSQSEAENLLIDSGAISYDGPFMLNDYVVTINRVAINSLSNEDLVQWIEAVSPPPVDLNDGARAAVSANEVQVAPYNLYGTGVKVGMWESTNPDLNHDDLTGRVTNVEGSVGDHATHVAGTLGGDGTLSSGTYRGIATNVNFYSYTTQADVDTIPDEHNAAIGSGIDLSQNSWGVEDILTMGNYTTASLKYDNIVRGFYHEKKIPIIFAAGNSQLDKPPNGFNTVLAPGATAKNTIAVGATRSDNDDIAKYDNLEPPSSRWGSSFGPTDDGRIKPDVMAPGCEKAIPRNKWYASIWSTISPDTYGGKCGTSMSSPIVSGAISLMLEQFGESTPLPSTLKAILIHTAADLDTPGPDFKSGYGRINITTAIDTIIDPNNIIIEDNIINGEADTYLMYVPPGTEELKVTLVWDDEPGTLIATKKLINDLDLVLKDPSDALYLPLILNPDNPADPAINGIDDGVNNVEQVNVTNPSSGIWRIEVKGDHIPNPPQDYSLVYQNECNDADGDDYNSTGGVCGPIDCDDTPISGVSIYPGAPELCNGVDDDCDSLIDEVCVQINQGWNIFSPTFDPMNQDTDRNISLKKGWNMFGYSSDVELEWENEAQVSKLGEGPFSISVAASEPYKWLQKTIYYYDGVERYTPDSGDGQGDDYLRQNRGYWLYALEDGLNLTLPGVGGSTSGQTYDWADLRFHNGSDELDITDARSVGWINTIMYYWDPSARGGGQFRSIPTHTSTFNSWQGYFVYSYYDNIILITEEDS
jgi:hypothetical protein